MSCVEVKFEWNYIYSVFLMVVLKILKYNTTEHVLRCIKYRSSLIQ